MAAEALAGAATPSTPACASPQGAMHFSASTEALALDSGFVVRARSGVRETGFVTPTQVQTFDAAAWSACVPESPSR
jgi:hypothetical protein